MNVAYWNDCCCFKLVFIVIVFSFRGVSFLLLLSCGLCGSQNSVYSFKLFALNILYPLFIPILVSLLLLCCLYFFACYTFIFPGVDAYLGCCLIFAGNEFKRSWNDVSCCFSFYVQCFAHGCCCPYFLIVIFGFNILIKMLYVVVTFVFQHFYVFKCIWEKGGLVATLQPHEIIGDESKSKIICLLVKMVHYI